MNKGVKFGLLLGAFLLMTTLGYAQDIESALNEAALRKQQELMDRRLARREKQTEKEKKKLEKKERSTPSVLRLILYQYICLLSLLSLAIQWYM